MRCFKVTCKKWRYLIFIFLICVWITILISIFHQLQFSKSSLTLKRRISEQYITVQSKAAMENEFNSMNAFMHTVKNLKTSVMTTAHTAKTLTKTREIFSSANPGYLSKNSDGNFTSTVRSLNCYTKFTINRDHSVDLDVKSLLPGMTGILDLKFRDDNNTYFNPNRILHQLNHIPSNYNRGRVKTVYLSGNQRHWHHSPGMSAFEQCPIDACEITYDKKHAEDADALIFSNPGQLPLKPPFPRKSQRQIWAISIIESPSNTRTLIRYRGVFNWTMTYRFDSVIETPYLKYQKYVRRREQENTDINFANGKSKKVAWMVSNCFLTKSGRMNYAKELAKYTEVDIYGRCGTKSCPRKEDKKCMDMIKNDYKFYLAFENTKCLDYVTEKPLRALENNAIPIVLGASKHVYRSILPTGSYIHVEDFRSPKELAQYLHKLDNNDTLYNEYFRWKGEGEFLETKPWCRLCSLLHEETLPAVWYDDIESWWRPKGVCIGENDWSK